MNKRPKPLRIAFDMDGVVADLTTALRRHSVALFGDAGEVSEHRLMGGRRRKLWDHVRAVENFWESLDETEPGGVARLAALVAGRRWEVIFVTKRPQTAGASAQVQSQRWLATKGFPLPAVCVVQRSRTTTSAPLTGLPVTASTTKTIVRS